MNELDLYRQKTLKLFLINQKKLNNQRSIEKLLKSSQFEKQLKIVEIYNQKAYKKLSPQCLQEREKKVLKTDLNTTTNFCRYYNMLNKNSSKLNMFSTQKFFKTFKSKDLLNFNSNRKLVKVKEKEMDIVKKHSYNRIFYPCLSNSISRNNFLINHEKEQNKNLLPPPNSQFNKSLLFKGKTEQAKQTHFNNILRSSIGNKKLRSVNHSQMDFYNFLLNNNPNEEFDSISRYVSSLSNFPNSPILQNAKAIIKNSNSSNVN